MIKIISTIVFSLCFAGNPVHDWIESRADILSREIKTVSFKISVQNELTNNININPKKGNITVGSNRQFRFEMGPRTVISTGEVWKSYDKRTNQIFIKNPDKKFEDLILSWMEMEQLKTADVELMPNGSFKLGLGDSADKIFIFFENDQRFLKSIVIKNRNVSTIITDIKLIENKLMDLKIGREDSIEFDLRRN